MVRKLIFISILFLLSIPFLDTLVGGVIKTKALEGDYTKSKDITFNYSSFLTGEFQNQRSIFLNENLNLHPLLVRIRNQYLFSIFKETKAFHTAIGNDNYLFDISYIAAYYGKDFIGEETINQKVKELKFLNDVLKYNNKKLLVCFLPGKASFYPEKIPSHYTTKEFNTTNIDFFSKKLKENIIPVLNLKDFFINAKDSSIYSLYSKYGIHLSTYGTILAADTLTKYIESITSKDIPNPIITKIEVTNQQKFYDNDIYKSLNLLIPLKMDSLAYPTISYTQGTDQCKVLTIGDSFYKYIFDSGIHTKCFNNGQFWFYSKKVWPLSTQTNVKDLNIRNEVLQNDLVVFFATEATLYNFPYDAIDIILPEILPLDKNWIKKYFRLKIDRDRAWQASIQEKADGNHISFEEQKQNDINYLLEEHINNLGTENKKLFSIIERIKSDSTWLNNIQLKALENNKNINEMIYIDALYILNTEN